MSAIKEFFEKVKTQVVNVINVLKPQVVKVFKKVMPVIMSALGVVLQFLDSVYRKISSGIQKLVSKLRKMERKDLRSNVIFFGIVGCVVIALAVICIVRWNQDFEYAKELDETLFYYADQEVKLSAVSYYIMIEEESVNELANDYNQQNALEYWNINIGDGFVSNEAKAVALNYCIRDVLYAHKAKEIGYAFTADEIEDLSLKAKNIYAGLTEKQKSIGITEQDIFNAICNNEMADRWVRDMARKEGITMTEKVLSAYYGINSYFFKDLMSEMEFQLNDKLWDEVSLGSLTIN